MARVEDPWDLEKQATHVSTSGAHDSLVLDDKHENIENCNEAVVLEDKKDDREAEQQPPTNVSLGQLSQLNLSAIESRDVDAKKVKVLLNIKALAQDQELAGDRRKASSSYLGTGRTVGDREAKDIGKLLKKLHQQNWKKSATTGNAEPLLRARRDVELCEAVQQDLALCMADARAPALLWSSKPPKNARRLGSLDMMSEVLSELENQFGANPVAQDLETLKRVTFLEQSASADFLTKIESYTGTEGEPGSPTGLAHTIARKNVGHIHAEIQVSPFVSAALREPKDIEAFRKLRSMWPAASGIGSLGPTFGTSRSLFDIKDHGIQESEMVPVDAYDVATLAHCKDYASMEEVGRPVHPKGVTTDGLLTVSPQHFGIKTFTSNADYSAESPAGIRSPDRAGRPVGFDMMMEQTHPQQRSPRQHRRDLNMERGPETHDEKHRMARSIASFRDIVPSTILEVTANYQEFYPAAKEMTTAASRAAALPFVVTNNSLIAPGNTKLPSVYYMGDGVFAQHDDLAKSKEAAETNGELPKLPSLTTFAPPVFCVNGAAVPSTAVAVRHMRVKTVRSKALPSPPRSSRALIEMQTPDIASSPTTRPGTCVMFSRPTTRDQARSFTPPSPWFTVPTTPNNPAETGIVFINKAGDISQDELDSFYPHFEEFTLGRRIEQRHGSPSRLSTPRSSTSAPMTELSLPSASSATRQLKSSDTTRNIWTADLKDWTVPRTPRPKEEPERDPRRPPVFHRQPTNVKKTKHSPPRTPKMENAHPPEQPTRLKKADALRDLLEAREGFKAQKEFICSVDVAINEGGHGYWDTQTLWCVGGMLIFESEPYEQMVTVWQAPKRGVPGQYAQELVNESKLTRASHIDEIMLLQERALQDKPFALDIVSAEMAATFKSKFVWKKGITGLRAERGDFLRVYRAKNENNVYAEFRGYPGVVPASTIEISSKATKKSVTMAFKSLQQLHQCVEILQQLVPKAGLRLEPRTALINAFGREGIANKKTRHIRSGLHVAFAVAHTRMAELKALVEQEHEMVQGQGDKSVMMGLPRRQVMAKDLKNLPASTLNHQDKDAEAEATIAGPPTSQPPSEATSPLSKRAQQRPPKSAGIDIAQKVSSPRNKQHAAPEKGKSFVRPKKLVKFEVCAVCEKRGQCLVNVPKYCSRCALKSVYDNLNKGDLREATVALHHIMQLVHTDDKDRVKEVTIGESSALQTRCSDAQARVQEATRLKDVRDLFRAAHCGDVTTITRLAAESGLDISTRVDKVEWVPGKGFLTTHSVLRGFSAVHYACMAFTGLEMEGKKEALIELVDRLKLDPHTAADDGRMPIHISVNEMTCLNYLIMEAGGNPEWRDGDGRTVLHHAAMYGSLDCRIFLVGVCDADATVKDHFNKTPVDYSQDIAMLVRKERIIKMICSFFRNGIVLKCFLLMKKHKKEPPYMLKFVPTEERKQKIELSARVVRRRLYQDWNDHGHPRLLKPWSSLLREKSVGLSLQSELSRLSDMEWSNALEWSWYIAHESPDILSPCDTPVQEFWDGDANDFEFDMSLINAEDDEDLNMTMALHGLNLAVSAFVVHYDAKVVYKLESRPPTREKEVGGRVRTSKDPGLRTRKPNVRLQLDGTEAVDPDQKSQAGSLWGRVGSFTRVLSFGRALSGSSKSAQKVPGEEDGLARTNSGVWFASSLSRAFSSGFGNTASAAESTKSGGDAGDTLVTSLGAKAVAASFLQRTLSKPGSRESDGEHVPHPPDEQRTAVAVMRTAATFRKSIIAPSATE